MLKRILAVLLLLSAVGFAQVATEDGNGLSVTPDTTDPSGLTTTVTTNFTSGGGNDWGIFYGGGAGMWDVLIAGPIQDIDSQHQCFAAGHTDFTFNGGNIFATLATNVNLSAASAKIAGTNDGTLLGLSSGKLYQYLQGTGQFTQITTAPTGLTDITASVGHQVYMLGATVNGNNVYKYDNSTGTFTQPLPAGVFTDISVADDGSVWVVNSAGKVLRRSATGTSWIGPLSAPVNAQQVVARGVISASMLGTDGKIYIYNSGTQAFAVGYAVSPTTYPIKEIGVYNNNMHMITTQNVLYRWSTLNVSSGSWTQINGFNIRHLSVGGAFDIYGVNGNGALVRYLPTMTKSFAFNAAGSDGAINNHSNVNISNLPEGSTFLSTSSTTVNGSSCANFTTYAYRVDINWSPAHTQVQYVGGAPYNCSGPLAPLPYCTVDVVEWCTPETAPPSMRISRVQDSYPILVGEGWIVTGECFKVGSSWFCFHGIPVADAVRIGVNPTRPLDHCTKLF